MTRNVVTLQPMIALEEAWSLLRDHKIKALPVLDRERRVVGVVTIADFLKQFDNKNLPTLGRRLRALLRRAPTSLRTVSAIMTSPVITVPAHVPVVELVSCLDVGVTSFAHRG